ncbi:MAG: zinc ABC transporter substrate-binding protein [Deltaproteobacteria bacterium]|nr:zinc ABC transporter substrate-binding protein [Deltaproteobacteria bacterium]
MRTSYTGFKVIFSVIFIFTVIASNAAAKLNVVTTTTDLAYIVKSLGGESVTVESIVKGYQDPHYVQAKPSFLVALSKADLFVINGLDLEIGYVSLLLQGARTPGIMPGTEGFLDCSVFIKPIEVPQSADRTKGDIHPLGNPHYWLDPQNAALVAGGIAARLIKLMPQDKSSIEGNMKKLLDSLREAEDYAAKKLAPFREKHVITYHATFNYFLKRFGIRTADYIEPKPGIPPTPLHIHKLINEIKTEDVFVILNENYFEDGAARMISEKSGVPFKALPSSVGGEQGVESLEGLYRHIADTISGL